MSINRKIGTAIAATLFRNKLSVKVTVGLLSSTLALLPFSPLPALAYIHVAPLSECKSRTDFLKIWNTNVTSGITCYADTGQLDARLNGVSKITTGKNNVRIGYRLGNVRYVKDYGQNKTITFKPSVFVDYIRIY
jgi:hypothetical protein